MNRDAGLLRIALSISADADVPVLHDVIVEVRPGATVRDLTEEACRLLRVIASDDMGLVRRLRTDEQAADAVAGASGYLPGEALVEDCGLVDGMTLLLRDRTQHAVPDLPVDMVRAFDDLFLIDERGSHRGRVTRLPRDAEVSVGSAPPGEHRIVVDDREVPAHAMVLVNKHGQYVECRIIDPKTLMISGSPAAGEQMSVLPGGSIGFRREGTDFVTFTVTTAEGAEGRSPSGKIQFDPAARLADPDYPHMTDQAARVPATPTPPEPQPFPWEQVLIPLAIVAALYLATRSPLTLMVTPLAAVVPIVSFTRQRRTAERRYNAEREKWVRKLEKISGELTENSGIEEGNLRLETPPVDVWVRRGYRRLAGLWGRSPDRADFLRVSVGFGELDSRFEVGLPDGLDTQDADFKRIFEIKGRQIGRDTVRPKLFQVPFTVDMREHHLGVVGPIRMVKDVATDLLLQLACAHPPGMLGLAALLPQSEYVRNDYEWFKWLPHTRAGSTLLPAERLFAGRRRCNDFLEGMRALHQERRSHHLDETDSSFALLVVHESAEVDVSLLEEVCALAGGTIRVLWLGTSADSAPQLVTTVIELEENRVDLTASIGRVLSGDPATTNRQFSPGMFRTTPARIVRALAPLYDPRASGANAGIPASAPLSAVTPIVPVEYPGPDARTDLGKQLKVPLGLREAGVFELDLVRDGPHVLVGGTTGSGKSELLQTLTSGLAGRYGPHEVSLFLVDFKGGATFAPFEHLPHVVGYVSDLDQRNVDRALAFLRAELRRREGEFQRMGNAKEFDQYLSRCREAGRTDTLPRLVIIFDEFATIVQEFERSTMPAVIDIAQRGRSWGLHLILATQQPTRDVVVPKVRANVTARIALRTLSPDDSATIIDRPDATRIPRALPGRALIRLEGDHLVEFQTAFAGAAHVQGGTDALVTAYRFSLDAARPAATPASGAGGASATTEFEQLIANIEAGGVSSHRGAVRMLPPLEHDLNRTPPFQPRVPRARPDAPYWVGRIAIGLRDLPHLQQQQVVEADLTRGAVCVGGPAGSGRTEALSMMAKAFLTAAPDGATPGIVCIDGGEKLSTLLADISPHIIAVPMTRTDLVTRLVDQLWAMLRYRMSGDDDQAIVPAYTGRSPVLLLIDGFDVLARSFEASGIGHWAAELVEVISQGRRHGVYVCVASRTVRDFEGVVRGATHVGIELHAQYEQTTTAVEDRKPGFGLDDNGFLVQMYQDPRADRGYLRIPIDAALAAFLEPDGWRRPEPTLTRTPGVVALGLDDTLRVPVTVDLAQEHVLIVGGPRSGRSTLLGALGRQLSQAAGRPVGVLAGLPGRGPSDPLGLAEVGPAWLRDFVMLPDNAERARVADEAGLATLPDGRLLLLVDDTYATDKLPDGSLIEGALDQLFAQSYACVIAVTTAQTVNRSLLTMAMKAGGVTVYLKPSAAVADADDGWRVRGVSFRHRPAVTYRRGDAIVQTETTQHVIHLAGAPAVQEAGL